MVISFFITIISIKIIEDGYSIFNIPNNKRRNPTKFFLFGFVDAVPRIFKIVLISEIIFWTVLGVENFF